MSVIERNNVRVQGSGDRAMVFAHGFGCDQNMWRFVAPEFEKDFRVVLFDHVGAGNSDLSAYDPRKYATLSGYADDVVEVGRALSLKDAVFVGHSVSAMIGVFGFSQGARHVRAAGPRRPVGALHRRRRLRRRVQREADRRAPRVS
jgi:sigma-B regulation protein RsbQ